MRVAAMVQTERLRKGLYQVSDCVLNTLTMLSSLRTVGGGFRSNLGNM